MPTFAIADHQPIQIRRPTMLTPSSPAAVTLAALAALFSSVSNAKAQETGLHKLHNVARSGPMLCMTDHEHLGETSPPAATASAAKSLAIRAWTVFTADEYGKPWGNYALAVGKRETCTGSPPDVVCRVTARPCRSAK
jgi:hypothetical protein